MQTTSSRGEWRQPDAVFAEAAERRLEDLRARRLDWRADPLGRHVGPLSLVAREPEPRGDGGG